MLPSNTGSPVRAMDKQAHLLLSFPETWNSDQMGDFFESLVSEILQPMRYVVTKRIRFSGMEIDLLAKNQDQPRIILVECKAHRDPIPSEVISKLLGNVALRKAASGWLFTASDLTKDAKGQWEEIQSDPELHLKFTWFPPQKILDLLMEQRSIVNPMTLAVHLRNRKVGDWTLVLNPRVALGSHRLLKMVYQRGSAFLTRQLGFRFPGRLRRRWRMHRTDSVPFLF